MSQSAHIRTLREVLLQARRRNDRAAVPRLEAQLRSLAERGYRCCLADFDACRPAYYIRLVDFEAGRVTAELEFPIDPAVASVQRLPLSHLVDYEEAEPEQIRHIYEALAPYLHRRRPSLAAAPPPPTRRPAGRCRVVAAQGAGLWWATAASLLLASLALLLVA